MAVNYKMYVHQVLKRGLIKRELYPVLPTSVDNSLPIGPFIRTDMRDDFTEINYSVIVTQY